MFLCAIGNINRLNSPIVEGLVTQSMLVKFLLHHVDTWGDRLQTLKISDFYEDLNNFGVYTVHHKSKAINAFHMISTLGVGGIAIVGDEGELLDNISAADIKVPLPYFLLHLISRHH